MPFNRHARLGASTRWWSNNGVMAQCYQLGHCRTLLTFNHSPQSGALGTMNVTPRLDGLFTMSKCLPVGALMFVLGTFDKCCDTHNACFFSLLIFHRLLYLHSPQSEELAFSSVGADWSIPWDEEESSERASTSGLNPQRRRNPLRFLASRLRGRV